jgi:hypothetical protein
MSVVSIYLNVWLLKSFSNAPKCGAAYSENISLMDMLLLYDLGALFWTLIVTGMTFGIYHLLDVFLPDFELLFWKR